MGSISTPATNVSEEMQQPALKRQRDGSKTNGTNTTNIIHSLIAENRLGKRAHPLLITHVNKLELDDELVSLDEYILTDLAHAVMLTRTGIFQPRHGGQIVQALLTLWSNDPRGKLILDPAIGTLGLQIERYLESALGSHGADIQRARSRIDQKATNWRLVNRRHLTEVIHETTKLASQVLTTAERYTGALMPGYTHLQHSQPTTVDHYLNAHYWAISRNVDRLLEAYDRLNLSPLGGAAYSGTSWPIDREATAAYLGFDRPINNARDAGFASIDMGAELANVLAQTLSCISRLASDINYWSSSEVGLAKIDASLCGTSSMMPQKRNPMTLERIRGLAGVSLGWAASQLGVMHTATSTDVDQAYIHNLFPGQCQDTAGAIALLREIIATVEFDLPRMQKSAGAYWSTASALADHLVATSAVGLSFREAHEAVAQLVAAHENHGAGELRADLIPTRGPLSQYSAADLTKVLDSKAFVDSRISSGGTAISERQALAAAAIADLHFREKEIDDRCSHTKRGLERLLRDAEALTRDL